MTFHPRSLALLGVIAMLSLAGCSTSPARRSEAPAISFDDVVTHADRQTDRLTSLQGEGNLQIDAPSFSQSASFSVVLLRPDSLQIIIEGPFGIRVAQALVTRERFQLYNSLQNRLYSGETSPENLEKTLRIGLTFDDILSLFTGGTILTADRTASYDAATEGDDALFIFSGDRYARRYIVDPLTKDIRKIQLLNHKGTLIGEQSFASFETVDGITYPRKITITQHEERRRVSLFFDSITWNTATAAAFTFDVPSNADLIELK